MPLTAHKQPLALNKLMENKFVKAKKAPEALRRSRGTVVVLEDKINGENLRIIGNF
ncbi:hypothetical protein [Marinilabilia salmonicolor]|jgi:hypothetical protein|uniref:Uncharacterized protein n=1 Tax=Marinilabilia salmonicolor TaxID=989 RepID=A0A2T0WQA1_9BACT|nr:hypothetical protein [Marinilabilia salmonicolor]PRY88869.1 hypothetical protein BY457_1303 [Marinilabilia salmonicolor]RCW28846.1 hypothetical protein DFO77_13529 [Marinilabilia salmonicolor]